MQMPDKDNVNLVDSACFVTCLNVDIFHNADMSSFRVEKKPTYI